MNLKRCDRCGAITPESALCANVEFPEISIMMRAGTWDYTRAVDLCPKCKGEFLKWVSGKENEDAKIH